MAAFRNNFIGDIDHVVAHVAVFRDFGFNVESLQIAGIKRALENVHLIARVIEVVFFFHLITTGAEDTGQSAAQNRAAAVGDMHRAGWIDADKFNLNFLTLSDIVIAEGFTLLQDAVDLTIQPFVAQGEVNESRRRHDGAFDFLRSRQ